MSPLAARDLFKGDERWVLTVLLLGLLMAALDIAIVGPALPAIKADLGIGDREAVWIFNVYVLMYMIGTPLMAKLSEIFGRRSVYILDVSLFAIGSLTLALTPSFEVLLLGRAVQGFGAGGIFPVAIAFVGSAFPPEKRGKALGSLGSIFGIAFILGPVLGGLLLPFSWKLLFLINIPVSLGIIALGLRVLPRGERSRDRPFDRIGLAIMTAAVVALTYGINKIDTTMFVQSIQSPEVWPFILTALVLFPLFWWNERRSEDPIIRTDLFETRQLSIAGILAFFAGLMQPGMIFVPALAVVSLGMKPETASLMMIPMVISMAVGSNIIGALLDRHGSRRIILYGAAISSMGAAILSQLSGYPSMFIIGCAVCGIGFSGMAGAPISYIVISESPPEDRATSQGAVSLYSSIGMMAGAALFGALVASMGGGIEGYRTAYVCIGLMALTMAGLATGLKKRRDEQEAARAPVPISPQAAADAVR